MHLVIGLGNPGKRYELTRNNAGFLFMDFLRERWDFPAFSVNEKFEAEISEGRVGREKVMLVKPQTFMNESGKSIAALLSFYKLTPKDTAVIHDDLDIAPATFRTTHSSRAAGHNGVQDIIDKLGTQDFYRLRLGIGRPQPDSQERCISSHDFVLENFSQDERKALLELFPAAESELKNTLVGDR